MRTIVVEEDIVLAVVQDTLTARSVNIVVGSVHNSATSIDQVRAILVQVRSSGVHRPSDTNTVSVWKFIISRELRLYERFGRATHSCPAAGSALAFRSQH